jgi:hypothetical protein
MRLITFIKIKKKLKDNTKTNSKTLKTKMITTMSKFMMAFGVTGLMLTDGGLDESSCWKKAEVRQEVEWPSECPAGTERDGLLCFEECKDGFEKGGISGLCSRECPDEFNDDGLYCTKRDTYWTWGGCRSGFHQDGAFCSRDCPDGTTDIFFSCVKEDSYMVAPQVLQCKDGWDHEGLCYPPCEFGAEGVGPVCWGSCPAGKEECGAICLGEDEDCLGYIWDTANSAISLATSFAQVNIFGMIIHTIDLVDNLDHPECPAW